MPRSRGWWVPLALALAAAPAGAQLVPLRYDWPEAERRYLGEWTGTGTMPMPVLAEDGSWQRLPLQLQGGLRLGLRARRTGDRETTLELRPARPVLRLAWEGEQKDLPVTLAPLQVAVGPRGELYSVLPIDPRAPVEIPPTLFDLPLDYFSLFYSLLFPLLPADPIEPGASWREEGALPVMGDEVGRMTITHRFVGWETRADRRCARLESEWETPPLRQSFQVGGQTYFVRTRWQGQVRAWFDPEEGCVYEAEAPLQVVLALQFVLPSGHLFDGEAELALLYRLRRAPEIPAEADAADPWEREAGRTPGEAGAASPSSPLENGR